MSRGYAIYFRDGPAAPAAAPEPPGSGRASEGPQGSAQGPEESGAAPQALGTAPRTLPAAGGGGGGDPAFAQRMVLSGLMSDYRRWVEKRATAIAAAYQAHAVASGQGAIDPWPALQAGVALCHDALMATTCLESTRIHWITRTALGSLGQSALARDAFPWEYGLWDTYPPRDVPLDLARRHPF